MPLPAVITRLHHGPYKYWIKSVTTVKVCQCIAYNVVQTFKIMPRKAAVHVPRKVAYPCSLSVRKEHCMQEGIDRMRNKLIADEDILAAP